MPNRNETNERSITHPFVLTIDASNPIIRLKSSCNAVGRGFKLNKCPS